MREKSILIFLCACCVATVTPYDWPALRAKWGTIPLTGTSYTSIIRKGTVDVDDWELAEDAGWNFEIAFNVTIFCLKNDPTMCSVYDVKNHIIGMQIGFPVNTVDAIGSPITFKNKPYVKKINRFGTDVYVMTLLFVDPVPELFLSGRSEWTGNVGDGLWLLNWSGEKHSFTKIPTDLADMRAEGFTKHRCVNGMGTHYFKDMDSQTSCSDIYPIFIVYDDEKPVGFGIYTLGRQYFNKYSKWNEISFGYPVITKEMPVCLLLSSIYPGIIVTHFYFTPEPTMLKCTM